MKIWNARINYLLFLISAAAHLFAFFEYRYMIESFAVPEHWHIQFYILLLVSLILSLILAVFKRFKLIIILLRFISLLIIGYPLGQVLGIEIVLLITIILDTIYYFPPLNGLAASILLIIIEVLNQKPVNLWGEELNGADLNNLLLMIFISMLILLISFYLKRLAISSRQNSMNLSRLNNALKEITRVNLDFQNYAKSVEHDSIENERKRVSREMHDIIGYTLTNQLMIIQAALSMKDTLSPQLESLLLKAQQQTQDGMADARSALYKLRDFSPQREIGLKLIYKLTRTFEDVTGVIVDIDFGNSPLSLGKEIDSAVYRLVQEGMTNAFRHGKATKIKISLLNANNKIHVNISDNGKSSDIIHEGIGLKGMRERIEGLGGIINTTSLSSGFSIHVQIPYKQIKDDSNETPTRG